MFPGMQWVVLSNGSRLLRGRPSLGNVEADVSCGGDVEGVRADQGGGGAGGDACRRSGVSVTVCTRQFTRGYRALSLDSKAPGPGTTTVQGG